jgi:hypothetical protein
MVCAAWRAGVRCLLILVGGIVRTRSILVPTLAAAAGLALVLPASPASAARATNAITDQSISGPMLTSDIRGPICVYTVNATVSHSGPAQVNGTTYADNTAVDYNHPGTPTSPGTDVVSWRTAVVQTAGVPQTVRVQLQLAVLQHGRNRGFVPVGSAINVTGAACPAS